MNEVEHSPLEVICPRCGAAPGEACAYGRAGKRDQYKSHQPRAQRAEAHARGPVAGEVVLLRGVGESSTKYYVYGPRALLGVPLRASWGKKAVRYVDPVVLTYDPTAGAWYAPEGEIGVLA